MSQGLEGPAGFVDTRGIVGRAILAGTASALLGGIAWAIILVFTHYEVGYVATAIGLLAGFAVYASARKRRALLSDTDWVQLQVVAVVSSLVGLLVGKYLIFDLTHGGLDADVSQVRMLPYFVRTLPETVTPFDAIWAGLAVYAAWKITRLNELGRRR